MHIKKQDVQSAKQCRNIAMAVVFCDAMPYSSEGGYRSFDGADKETDVVLVTTLPCKLMERYSFFIYYGNLVCTLTSHLILT
jgi:hypothetical protein